MVPELGSELDPRSSALTPLGFEYGASKMWKEMRAELYGAPGKYRSFFAEHGATCVKVANSERSAE